MKAYRNDPRWLTARFESKCQCGNVTHKGGDIYYYPLTKTALCKSCGEQATRDFEAAAFDDFVMSGNR